MDLNNPASSTSLVRSSAFAAAKQRFLVEGAPLSGGKAKVPPQRPPTASELAAAACARDLLSALDLRERLAGARRSGGDSWSVVAMSDNGGGGGGSNNKDEMDGGEDEKREEESSSASAGGQEAVVVTTVTTTVTAEAATSPKSATRTNITTPCSALVPADEVRNAVRSLAALAPSAPIACPTFKHASSSSRTQSAPPPPPLVAALAWRRR